MKLISADCIFGLKSFHVLIGKLGDRFGSYLNVRIFTIDDGLIIGLFSTT